MRVSNSPSLLRVPAFLLLFFTLLSHSHCQYARIFQAYPISLNVTLSGRPAVPDHSKSSLQNLCRSCYTESSNVNSCAELASIAASKKCNKKWNRKRASNAIAKIERTGPCFDPNDLRCVGFAERFVLHNSDLCDTQKVGGKAEFLVTGMIIQTKTELRKVSSKNLLSGVAVEYADSKNPTDKDVKVIQNFMRVSVELRPYAVKIEVKSPRNIRKAVITQAIERVRKRKDISRMLQKPKSSYKKKAKKFEFYFYFKKSFVDNLPLP